MTGLNSNDDKEIKSSINKSDNENDWENLYDDSGESVLAKLEKLNLDNKSKKSDDQEEKVKNPKPKAIDKPNIEKESAKLKENSNNGETKIDYLKFDPKTIQDSIPNEDEEWGTAFSHILEIYDFPTSFKNENIMNAFKESIGNENFSLKWVDDNHCLGIFSNENEALRALKLDNALIKTRPISQASAEGKRMAKRRIDSLKPYKPRPQTSSFVASKLIGASLGLSNMLPKDKIAMERNKIKEAKDKRLREKDLKESIWNGEA